MKRYWISRVAENGKTLFRQLFTTLILSQNESVFVNGEEFIVTA